MNNDGDKVWTDNGLWHRANGAHPAVCPGCTSDESRWGQPLTMTIEAIRQLANTKNLKTAKVYVQTTLSSQPLRVKAIGRLYVTVLLSENIRQITPAEVKAVKFI